MTHNQPPAQTQGQPQPPVPQTTPGRAARPVMYVTAFLGGVALLGVAASAAYATAGTQIGAASGDNSRSVSATGISELDLDISVANFTLEYGAVRDAELTVTGANSDRWELQRDRNTLVVTSPERFGGGSCLFGFCPPDRAARTTVTLTLPQALKSEALNADVDVSVGSFTADGAFDDLGVEVGAGEATVTGTARTLSVNVGVGSFTGELTGVTEADFEVSMGEVRTTLRGDAPNSIDVEVGTGSANLQLPDVEYRVDASVELGDLRNDLRTSSGSPNRIAADVSLGDLTLRPLG